MKVSKCIIILTIFFGFVSLQSQNIDLLEYKSELNGKLKIKVPSSFKLMNEQLLRAKYPQGNLNNVKGYSNENATINLLLNNQGNPLQNKNLKGVLYQTLDTFKRVPGLVIENSGIQNINGHDIVVIEFNSQAVDSSVYNIMFITAIDGKTFIGTFNCTINHLNEWKSIGREILDSIKIDC